ncbi:MAG: prepilin-type N-terminal cleavage/methylation domain-containing protein [Clostridia bacterium]|nr:prepilin-type N-terminal cleavage/methylation domain-containing protein [Clostridia bacterium]
MLGKKRRMLPSQKGFTLVELMTVLIILGVILAIGVPKYLKIQAKSEWDSDVVTIENIAKAAEVYAAQKNLGGGTANVTVNLKTALLDNNIVDGSITLNRRKASTGDLSEKNTGTKKTISDYGGQNFTINPISGKVTNLPTIIKAMIGNDPYN